MIDDLDASLASLFAALVPDDAKPEFRFETPVPEWTAQTKGQIVSAFLYDITERVDGRGGDLADVRDENGLVVARQPAVRRFRMTYLVSVFARSPAAEHRILGAILRGILDHDALPPEHLAGSLAGEPLALTLRVSTPGADADVRPHDIWSALGVAPRAALHVQVDLPVRPSPITEIAPPARELDLSVSKEDAEEHTQARQANGADALAEKKWTAFRAREHVPDAP